MYFPRDEVGRNRKLSRPWHGPYRVIGKKDPDITPCKVYFPDVKSIQVYQTRIQPCPVNFPAGYYWYGSRRVGPGHPPKWVERLMATDEPTVSQDEDDACEVEQGESEKVQPDPDPAGASQIGITSPSGLNPEPRKTQTRAVVPPVRYQS